MAKNGDEIGIILSLSGTFWRETSVSAFDRKFEGLCTSPLIIFQCSLDQLMSIFSAPKKNLT